MFGNRPDANVKDTLEFVEKVTKKAQRVIDTLAEEVVAQSVAAAPHDQSLAPRPGVNPKRYRLAGDHGIVTRRDVLRAAKEARLRVQSEANTARLAMAEKLADCLAQPHVSASDAFGVEGIETGAAKRLLDHVEHMLLHSPQSWAKHHTQQYRTRMRNKNSASIVELRRKVLHMVPGWDRVDAWAAGSTGDMLPNPTGNQVEDREQLLRSQDSHLQDLADTRAQWPTWLKGRMAADAGRRMKAASANIKKATEDKLKALRAKRTKVSCPHRDTLGVRPEASRQQILARGNTLSLECRLMIQSAQTAKLKQLARDKLRRVQAAACALAAKL